MRLRKYFSRGFLSAEDGFLDGSCFGLNDGFILGRGAHSCATHIFKKSYDRDGLCEA